MSQLVVMKVEVLVADILDVPADVMICTANQWLQMSGGVNLAILVRDGGEVVQDELQNFLSESGKRYVEPGTVVTTNPGPLQVKKILHAVSIDATYDTSIDLVARTIVNALEKARELTAKTVTLPALATGFGPLTMQEFATALRQALDHDWSPLETLKVVLKRDEAAEVVRDVLQAAQH